MFQPTTYLDIPHIDLLSYTFGNTAYDLDKPLFIDASNCTKSISHRQAKVYIRKLIAGFHAHGLKPGDSVCLHSFNSIYYTLIYLAVIGAGGCFVGSNPAYTTQELSHLFSISDVKFILVEPELLKKTLPSIKALEIPPTNVFLFNTDEVECEDRFESWNVLMQSGEESWVLFDDETRVKTTTAALLSTSGTTGLPKAAELSHYAHIAQNVLQYDSKDKSYEVRRLICLPQFHAFAAPLVHLAPLREGHKTYIMKRYHPEKYLEYLNLYGITETTMVNPIVLNILNLPDSKRESISCLRFIWIGGAPLDVSIQNKLIGMLRSDAIVAQVWGMTEIGWITTLHYPEKDDTGSVGRLLPNTEAKILDTNLEEVNEEGARGEILIRGPSIMTSYLKNPEATKITVVDGWLHTGDIGYQKEGKWYIVDRAKELIKVRGWQVSPTELEACLLTHPAILDSAVIGVDFDDGRGELPRAYVVLDPANTDPVTDGNIQEYLIGRLASYKALAGGVRRIDAIPRGASGKILKKILREKSKKEIVDLVERLNETDRTAVKVLEQQPSTGTKRKLQRQPNPASKKNCVTEVSGMDVKKQRISNGSALNRIETMKNLRDHQSPAIVAVIAENELRSQS